MRDARPQSQNGFKIELAKRCLVHALKLVTQDRLTTNQTCQIMPKSAQMSVDRKTAAADRWSAEGQRPGHVCDRSSIFPGLLYAVPVEATIANGKIEKLDTAAAEKMPGVRAIFHRANIGKIFRSTPGQGFEGICDERRPPFEDDVIRYYGQYVALAVADTFEAAKAAADAVRVTYAKDKANVATDLQADDDPEVVRHFVRSGRSACKASAAIPKALSQSAAVKLDQTYVTPTETHNPIELQAATRSGRAKN